jgi:hypothetical protein
MYITQIVLKVNFIIFSLVKLVQIHIKNPAIQSLKQPKQLNIVGTMEQGGTLFGLRNLKSEHAEVQATLMF